jgi:sugar phosphate isomerase/epimerase
VPAMAEAAIREVARAAMVLRFMGCPLVVDVHHKRAHRHSRAKPRLPDKRSLKKL